jgi:hypothetical protein
MIDILEELQQYQGRLASDGTLREIGTLAAEFYYILEYLPREEQTAFLSLMVMTGYLDAQSIEAWDDYIKSGKSIGAVPPDLWDLP